MAQNIYILSSPKHRSNAQYIDEEVISNGIFESENLELTKTILLDMAKDCMVEFFYVIIAEKKFQFPNFDFSFKPLIDDYSYMHIWNNDTTVRLFNKEEVLKDVSKFMNNVKNIDTIIVNYPIYDIIFLSFGEPSADENFNKLKSRWPRAKRIDGVKGIKEAHQEAAKIVTTDMFFVVDADAEIIPEFNFDKQNQLLYTSLVYVWYSINPVNGLRYGYGGIKLFSAKKVRDYIGNNVDFTTNVADGITIIPRIANITKFNTDPFSTWKSAFRECVKLSSKIIPGQLNSESERRLHTWSTIGNGEFGKYSIAGAIEGTNFGKTNCNQPEILQLINDFDWLRQKFNSQQ